MAHVKYMAVWFLDWIIDRYVVRHKSQRFCAWLYNHSWWKKGGR